MINVPFALNCVGSGGVVDRGLVGPPRGGKPPTRELSRRRSVGSETKSLWQINTAPISPDWAKGNTSENGGSA